MAYEAATLPDEIAWLMAMLAECGSEIASQNVRLCVLARRLLWAGERQNAMVLRYLGR